MPLGVLREALATHSEHHGNHASYAELIASPWARSHHHTSFGESQITTCQEGFRCVSRVKRFGADHTQEVQREKARQAQAENADAETEGKDGKSTEPVAEEYEFNCPVAQKWVANRFESGVEADQCREEKDCICIARGAEDSFTELKDGFERRHETVEAEVGCGGGKSQKIPIVVIPHYPLRKMSDGDVMNINSDMGEIQELPSEQWVNSYKNNAPKVQKALDSLKNWIGEQYDAKVAEKPYVCGPPVPDQAATMSDADVHEASVKIRNFQVLQKDCENLRDTVPMLISPTSEKVSPPGHNFLSNKKLNCYKIKNGDACVQLNCYTGHDDNIFRDHLREFEARMQSCEPEPEDVNAVPGADSPVSSIAPNQKAGSGVVAGGAAQAGGTAQQGVGPGAAALAVLLGRQNAGTPASGTSKRSTWRRFL